MNQVQLIWAHPRTDSLTARVVEKVRGELVTQGYEVTELDLYRSNFDPVLRVKDEPDWANPSKVHSDEVVELGAQLSGKTAAFIVFPVWWYSLPAILKGYIDRVWNSGIAYGNAHLSLESAHWIALAGESEASFAKRGLDKSLTLTLNTGIAGYCGIKNSKVTMLYDTHAEHADDLLTHHAMLIEQARQTVADWAAQT